MKKLIAIACLAATVSVTSGTAMADSIKGRIGVTGKIGFLLPSDNTTGFYNNDTDVGLIGGGGLIYGIDDHFAAELDITRAEFGSNTGDFGVTNVSLGGQYRFQLATRQLVPYVGAGLDILLGESEPNNGEKRDVDTTVGAHASAGIDYFILKQLALSAEAKLVVAPDTSIKDRDGNHRGDFDLTSFSSTIGVRYFFN